MKRQFDTIQGCITKEREKGKERKKTKSKKSINNV